MTTPPPPPERSWHVQDSFVFQSAVPLMARLRTGWLNMAARWYGQYLTAQQNEINDALAERDRNRAVEINHLVELIRRQDAELIALRRQIAELELKIKQLAPPEAEDA